MKVRLLLPILLLLIMAIPASAFPQAPPGVFADPSHPAGAPDPEKLDAVWQVDPLTGALNVAIPFTTTPSGGRGPHIPYSLFYNSSSTITLQTWGSSVVPGIGSGILNIVSAPQITEQFKWAPGVVGSSPQSPVGPWTISGPSYSVSVSTIPNQTYTVQPGTAGQTSYNYGDGCPIYGPYIYVDENGSAHDMNLEWDNAPTSNPSPPCSSAISATTTNGISSMTTDGSAIETFTGNQTPSINGLTPFLIYPNGTQLLKSGPMEDSNGNIAFTTDSAGRTPFSSTIPRVNGQIPVGTYSVVTKGGTGTAESYSVVVAAVPIGSFTMPHPYGSAEMHDLGFCVASLTCATNFIVIQPASGATLNAITSIGLPNGRAYTFHYDPTYGTISRIDFPTGGYVRFVWAVQGNRGGYGQFFSISALVVTDAYLSTGNGGESHWSYSFPSAGSVAWTSQVTAPDGTMTQYTATSLKYATLDLSTMGAMPSSKEALRQIYKSGGTLVMSEATQYSASGTPSAGLPTQIATTYYDGATPLQKQIQLRYDNYANAVEKDESDFYSCSGTPCTIPATPPAGWLRKTLTNYLWSSPNAGQPAYNYTQVHIVNKPSQVTVADGANNPVSITQFFYDQTALSGSAGIVNHDDVNFPATKAGPRGNLTSEYRCLLFSGTTCGTWNTPTKYTYDIAGMLRSVTDPRTNLTTLDYTDNYAGYTPAAPTDAYVTTVTRPQTGTISHIDTYTHFFYTGNLASHTTPNGDTTQYAYDDPLNRQTRITLPLTQDGTVGASGNGSGTTTTTYNDAAGGWSVQNSILQSVNGSLIVSTNSYDGLGRLSSSSLTSDPAGADTVSRTYGLMGRLLTITNPARGTSNATSGTIQFSYDWLGRETSQQQQDGSVLTWVYGGNCVDSYDETSRHWKRCSNGRAQLTNVWEPDGSNNPTIETDYAYSPANDLLRVDQWGGPKGNAGERVRTFAYNGMSWLTTSSNPETGTLSFGYDGNGNNTSKTDGRNVTVTYSYDQLNRIQAKTSPSWSWNYAYDIASTSLGFTSLHPIDHLVEASNGVNASEQYSYDAVGRIVNKGNCIPSNCSQTGNAFNALYDLAGDLVQLTYPDGRHITETWDAGRHLTKVAYVSYNGQVIGADYISSATYWPDGGTNTLVFGNGVGQTFSRNRRLQPVEISTAYNGTKFLDKQYCYGPTGDPAAPFCTLSGGQDNGNILHILDPLNASRSQAFSYDSMNRIGSFTNGDGSMQQTFSIDPWGNMEQLSGVGVPNFQQSFTATNQVSGYPYDAAGNLLGNGILISSGGQTYGYDADNNLVNFTNGSVLYTYNPEGQRVRKDAGSAWTEYLYWEGKPLSEKNSDGTWTDYIYGDGQLVARSDNFSYNLHVQGTVCGSCGWQYTALFLANQGGLANRVIQTGDHLYVRQLQQSGTRAGVAMNFTDGTYAAGFEINDQDGQPMTADSISGQWHSRAFDLSAWAGKTVQYVYFITDGETAAGAWSVRYKDFVFVDAHGTVMPLYTEQTSAPVGGLLALSGETGVSYSIEKVTNETQADTTVTYYHPDQIGSARMLSRGGPWPTSSDDFFPFGQERAFPADSNDYKFTGKERDAESGNDYFGARYFASTMGRFLSPDWSAKAEPVPYAKLDDPQSLNLYAYVRNNPLSRIDADGHYELNNSGCGDNAKCQKKWDKAANKFEARREKDLKSKNASVRAAAANYGARGEANGVHLGFASTAAQGILGSVDPSGSTPGNPNIQVTLDFGRAGSAETQTHEGTHVGDDQKFLNSFNPMTMGYDQALNPTHGQTEFNAFKAGAAVDRSHGFGPNDDQKILDFLHNSPVYGPIFNVPVFNPANFPAGVPDDEQQ